MTKQVQAQITPTAAMAGLVTQAIAQGATTKAEKEAKATPAKKVVAKKAAPATKKAATKAPTSKAAGTSKGAIKFGIHNGSRPVAGRALAAFTDAWLRGFGMDKTDGKAERSLVVKVAGSTAVSYHLGNKNLTEKGGVLSLTAKGRRFFFEERSVDEKTRDALLQALRTGTPDGEVFRNKDVFQAL